MGDQQGLSRNDSTLSQLFDRLIFGDPPVNYDLTVRQWPPKPQDLETRQWMSAVKQRATDIVHRGQGDVPASINTAQDLIKRKLLRENASPEKAAKFANLYSRLLSMPVLDQKWGILYLLYSLSANAPSSNGLQGPRVVENGHGTARERTSIRYNQPDSPDQDDSVSQRGPRYYSASPRRALADPQKVTDQHSPVQDRQRENDPPSAPALEINNERPVSSEMDILRDLPFNLQGLSSSNFRFSTGSVELPTHLPVPILSLLNALAEPCLLYRSLETFTNLSNGGLIDQSLRAAISTELRSYLSLVATLESEIKRAVTSLSQPAVADISIRKAGITLKRTLIHLREPTHALRLLSLVVSFTQSSPPARGGQIITSINNLATTHGDPFVSAFTTRLLATVTIPFYNVLRSWIYDGELVDPYAEFFVVLTDSSESSTVDPRRVSTSVWADQYKLESSLVPTIITPSFAQKIFLIGKSLNFIRHNCGDSDWVIAYSRTHSKPLDFSNTTALADSIDTAYSTTMSRLTHLMMQKFQLNTHIHALKKYLLLGQGDFIDLLVESLAPNLDRPAHSQYRHTLTSQLEHAIRHSNAQYDNPEVLARLDARMIELSRSDTGWDCFTLEYKISPPCDVIITQWANTQYLKVFNVMLRVKRVEFSLNQTWRRCMTGARGVLANVDADLASDWKRARCLIAEMVHFVNQLQYYILFEVVEANWKKLEAALDRPDVTLDELIEAHRAYIDTIVQKGLLASSAEREDGFLVQLHSLLKGMLAYREVVESLYSYCVGEESKRRAFAAKVERRTAAGKWGITEKDSSSRASTPALGRNDKWSGFPDDQESPVLFPGTAGDDQTLLVGLRKRMADISIDFKTRINGFLYDLAHQPDVDLRFLGVVMNFNEAYKPTNPRRRLRRDRARIETERERDQDKNRDNRRSHDTSSVIPSVGRS